jgi:hypothetical protein
LSIALHYSYPLTNLAKDVKFTSRYVNFIPFSSQDLSFFERGKLIV